MAMQEGYSTNRPPFFDGVNFQYWKGRMEYYLMTEIDNWFAVTEGFAPPRDELGKILPSAAWSVEQKRRAQADAKAVVTLQCGLAKDQLNKVGPFTCAQDLWNKLIELHEGTRDSRIAKRDLLLSQLQSFTMRDSESVSELHGRFKELFNGLHSIGESLENRDLVRYVLKAFPRNALWSSMVDAYKVSKDLSIIKIDELFCEMELHEQSNRGPKEKGVAFVAGERSKEGRRKKEKKKEVSSSSYESEDDSDSSSNEMVNLVRRMMRKGKYYNKKDVKRIFNDKKGKASENNMDKSNLTCFECNRKGHFRSECPKLKKKEERVKRKKALKATWDDSSSSSSEEEIEEKGARHTALMAFETLTEEEVQSEGETGSNYASSSTDDDEVSSPHLDKLYNTIACLSNALKKSKEKASILKTELKELKLQNENMVEKNVDSSQLEALKDENHSLKSQVSELKSTLEKFNNSSNTLNMILGAQRAVHNRAGIGYKTKKKEFSFMSLVSRTQTRAKVTKAWIPRKFLVDAQGPKIWVPKDLIFRV